MKNEPIICEILKIPENFNNQQDLSIHELLKNTGYFEKHEFINEKEIYNGLIHNNRNILLWLNWSESKRTNDGWCIEINNDKYFVSFHSASKNIRFFEFENLIDACAKFIKLEIESIRNI